MALELDERERVVTSLYQNILGRDPDGDGLKHYVNYLDSGHGVEDLISIFVDSPEFRKRVEPEHDITLTNVASWQGFGPAEIDYIRSWQDKDQAGRVGFLTDFVGVRTNIEILWDECAHLDGAIFPLPIPLDYHADILEYVGTLRAVDAAGKSFAVMELGAGMGPWTVTGGVAARRRGIEDIYLCAVEGDPSRHRMMLEHIAENRLDKVPQQILQAAVGVKDGEAFWPRLDNPTNQSAARPLRDDSAADAEYLDYAYADADLIRVEVVAFEKLLRKRDLWDLIHIDVQGTEAEICGAAIGELTARARYLVIGTHSRKLDGELIEIFHGAGWILENEKPAILRYDPNVPIEHMTIVDGTQIWRNPRL